MSSTYGKGSIMWVLVILTFGFVSTDKVVMQEFTTKERCYAAKELIAQLDNTWKRKNVDKYDIRESKNLAPVAECTPK